MPVNPVKYANRLSHYYNRLRYWMTVIRLGEGIDTKECPACGYLGKFKAFGQPPRYSAQCPNCSSLERHRLLCLALQNLPLLSKSEDVLHFAPEPIVSRLLVGYEVNYTSADVVPGQAARTLDLERIDLPSESVDVVVVNHVLEHVDDAAALAEIYRILKERGRFIATSPVIEGWQHTYENPEVGDDEGRNIHFGQADHVRFYGRDIRDRIRAVGFALDEFVGDGAEAVKYGLLRGERIFIGTKI